MSGGVQHLRPADGGVVTVENIRYVEGIFDVVFECVGLVASPRRSRRVVVVPCSFPAGKSGGEEGRPSLLHAHRPRRRRASPTGKPRTTKQR